MNGRVAAIVVLAFIRRVREDRSMRAFVISLARRADRLATFQQHLKDTGLDRELTIEVVPAIDGETLVLADVMPRVASPVPKTGEQPRSAVNLPERELRGILGCALSHLEAWRRLADLGEPAIVFEDDARLGVGVSARMFLSALSDLPRNADLCWLNDCHYDQRGGLRFRLRRKLAKFFWTLPPPRRVRFSPMPDLLIAADAYMLTPAFARRLRDALVDHIGAIDRHMQLYVAHTKAHSYQVYPPLFATSYAESDTSPWEAAE